MISAIRNLIARPKIRQPKLPDGQRVYAVGDVHGRLDLFERLLAAIDHDDAGRPPVQTSRILLGDLIDRGPDSAGVIARARQWCSEHAVDIVQGNHEELLLLSLHNAEALRGFLKFGGMQTLISYGLDEEFIRSAEPEALQRAMAAAIPAGDLAFMESFGKLIRIGDYLFVHAGVRPNTPLDNQLGQDCRWIREPFLSHDSDFGACIVHGHTITARPDVRANRIGIDTGAFIHGQLTALGIEGDRRWFIQAIDSGEGEFSVTVSNCP